MAGEEAILKIQSNRQCYISILNLLADDSFRILFPNPYRRSTLVKPGEKLIFPSQGLSLVMEPLPGHRRAAEAFLVVATKRPFHFHTVIGKSEKITISELSNALLTLPANERTEEMLVYEVRQE